jgi:hypothetical protein
MLRRGLLEVGFPADRILSDALGEEEAVQRSLETARPGDLLVVFGDKLDRDWRQIVSFNRPADAGIEVPVASLAEPVGSAADTPSFLAPIAVSARPSAEEELAD